MTMQPSHPDEERLSALAGADPEASGDLALREHVSSCDRCQSVVDELSTLRAALADLPDLAPHRPLRLLPAAEAAAPSFADRLAAFVRRGFAPALAAGVGLALIGAVGTANPAGLLPQAASAPTEALEAGGDAAAPTETEGFAEEAPAIMSLPSPDERSVDAAAGAAAEESGEGDSGAGAGEAAPEPTAPEPAMDPVADEALEVIPERSPWPMVLFAGIALIVAALLLRWILVPRAG